MKKLFSFVATLSLLINSLFTPVYALAQTVNKDPTSTPVDNVIEPATSPSEGPTETPTMTPAEISSSTPTPTTTEEPTPSPTDQPIETNAPESNPTVQGPPSTPETTPTPSETPVTEKEELHLSAVVLENEVMDSSVISGFDLTYQEDGSATISTDKLDYSPTDTAVISGTSFGNNKTYTINITSSDEPAVNFVDSLTSNDKGEVIYSYTLDGNYRPNYQVEVKDGDRVVAKTTFTDSVTGVETYSNSGYTNETYTFNSGSTVYAFIPGSNLYNSKFQWKNENGTVVSTSSCRFGGGPFTDSYVLIGANPGNWKVSRLYYSDYGNNCNNYLGSTSTNFTVASGSKTINSSSTVGGIISPSGSVSVNHGTNQSFIITPNSGYVVSDVIVDGVSQGRVDRYTFFNVTTNHTIHASFDEGWKAPTDYANGSISNESKAYTSNNDYATGTDDEETVYEDFNISIPSGSTIEGIEVATEGYRSSSQSRSWDISLSWNGGSSYTSSKNTGDLGTITDKTIITGGSSDKWGRTWSSDNLTNSNFRIKIHANAGNSNANYLDQIQVKIHFTLPPADSTAPVISKVVTGTTGTSAWYKSNVVVTWTVVDPESAITIDSGCGTQNFASETSGIVSSCTAHSLGGSSSDSVNIKIDKTSPIINLTGANPQTIELGSTYTELGAVVSDGLSGPGVLDIDSSDVITSSVGTYTVYYNAKDVAGNDATTVTRTVNVTDNTAPSVPVNGAPNGIAIPTNNFDFTWNSSTDASPITYEFQSSLNSAQTGGVLTTGLWHSGVLPTAMIHSSGAPDGKWYWQVRAIDIYGNTSAWSEIWDVTLDTTPPQVPNLNSPNDGWATKGVAFSQKWYPVSDAVLYEYESCNVDPGDIGEPCTSVKYSATYTGTTKNVGAGQPDSRFWWRVKAKDAVGNWSGWSESRELIIDNTTPTGSWINPTDTDTISGVITLNFEAQDSLSGIAGLSYQYKADNGVDTFHNITGNTWDTTALPLGNYIVRAIVTDNAGNVADFDITVGVAAIISAQNAVGTTTNSIVVTWTTDRPTTSRVVYDTVNHPELGAGDNYGYAFSTPEDTNKVTSHSVTLSGLATGVTYYYRVISHGSPTAIGGEGYAITLTNAGPPESSSGVGGGVLGASTILANRFPQLAYVGEDTSNNKNEAISGETEQNPNPEVLGASYNGDSQSEIFAWILAHKVISIGILLLVLLVIYLTYRISRKLAS